jgi:hypothetical protein
VVFCRRVACLTISQLLFTLVVVVVVVVCQQSNIMFRNTILLATASLFWAFTMVPLASAALIEAGNIRRMQEEEALFLPPGWVFAETATTSCDQVCDGVDKGSCNAAATNAVNTADKLEHVVEIVLKLPAAVYFSGNNPANPLRDDGQGGIYFFNPEGGTAGVCNATSSGDRRLCCCNSNAEYCPTGKPGLFGK